MNAYELEQAAFDTACDSAEETIEYIQGYADGAFDMTVSDAVAQKILDCRAACKIATEENGEGQNNGYHFVQVPLEQIKLGKYTTAENIQDLHNGGNEGQALRMANAESLSVEEFDDDFGGYTEFTFADNSIFVISKSGAVNVR